MSALHDLRDDIHTLHELLAGARPGLPCIPFANLAGGLRV